MEIKNPVIKREYPYEKPIWTEENINRKSGSTTFKQCGWCEHASCGSCRYSCYIETSCSLLKDYGIGKEVYWDTPCIIKMLGKNDLISVIKSKEHSIKSKLDAISELYEEISNIISLDEFQKNKPPLPQNRIEDYNVGETIFVFCKDKWRRGIVANGYRSHDGCVSYILEDYPETVEKPWGCGVSVPCILKEWEFIYFKTHPSEFKTWLALSDEKYNGDKLPLNDYYKKLFE